MRIRALTATALLSLFALAACQGQPDDPPTDPVPSESSPSPAATPTELPLDDAVAIGERHMLPPGSGPLQGYEVVYEPMLGEKANAPFYKCRYDEETDSARVGTVVQAFREKTQVRQMAHVYRGDPAKALEDVKALWEECGSYEFEDTATGETLTMERISALDPPEGLTAEEWIGDCAELKPNGLMYCRALFAAEDHVVNEVVVSGQVEDRAEVESQLFEIVPLIPGGTAD
ncbi:hypothetical protein [Salininema proteolyticum]|uniref:Sensor domain-containing protein n=1 Tax=Salininema proteolyticum TaxID=1607685 RepID=A0ABV8TZL0_9ACTN